MLMASRRPKSLDSFFDAAGGEFGHTLLDADGVNRADLIQQPVERLGFTRNQWPEARENLLRCQAPSDSRSKKARMDRPAEAGPLRMGLFADRAGAELLEEVVAFVVHEDEGGEILDGDFPDGFHSEFREGDDFLALDVVFGE